MLERLLPLYYDLPTSPDRLITQDNILEDFCDFVDNLLDSDLSLKRKLNEFTYHHAHTTLKQRALSKLTPEEREALGL